MYLLKVKQVVLIDKEKVVFFFSKEGVLLHKAIA
jgi:hypothetical protein